MTLFDWLNELTFNKRDWSTFSEDQRESFNSYMVHRYVSMYIGYVEIANVAQKLPLAEKEKIYNIYKTMLPKKKMFLKYVKNQNKKPYDDLLKYVSAKYFLTLRLLILPIGNSNPPVILTVSKLFLKPSICCVFMQ